MILLARHGETDYNVPPPRVQGRRDIPLNDRGREQARELAHDPRTEDLRAVWSSDLSRARETADIVAGELGVEVQVDSRLAESDRGSWEGRLLDDIAREEPELWVAWRQAGAEFRFPSGESLAEHLARVSAALEEVRAGELPALVVSHGGTIRCAFAASDPRGLDAFHELEVRHARLMRLP